MLRSAINVNRQALVSIGDKLRNALTETRWGPERFDITGKHDLREKHASSESSELIQRHLRIHRPRPAIYSAAHRLHFLEPLLP